MSLLESRLVILCTQFHILFFPISCSIKDPVSFRVKPLMCIFRRKCLSVIESAHFVKALEYTIAYLKAHQSLHDMKENILGLCSPFHCVIDESQKLFSIVIGFEIQSCFYLSRFQVTLYDILYRFEILYRFTLV